MAMSKKEQQEVERLKAELAMARALRWPSFANPPTMTRDEIKEALVPGGIRYGSPCKVARGWFMNSHSRSVTYGCSDGYRHAREGDAPGSQECGRMYRTEADAWRAMRHEATLRAAKELADIDAQIERSEKP